MSDEQLRIAVERRQRVRLQVSDAMSVLKRINATDKADIYEILIKHGVDNDVPAIKDALGKLQQIGVVQYTHPILLIDGRFERRHVLVLLKSYVAE